VKHLKSFNSINEATKSTVEDIFANFCERYGMEIEKVGDGIHQQHKLWTSGDFKEEPIIVDCKFISLLNTTKLKLELEDNTAAVLRFDYIKTSKTNKDKSGYLKSNKHQMSATFNRMVSFLRNETTDSDIQIIKIFIEIYI
jgi:hypothetical protein